MITRDQFQAQMKRLADTFGASAYGTERMKLIWRTVEPFDLAWLERTVSYFIGANRQAPLVSDFAEAAAVERERRWSREKTQHGQDATRFMSGSVGTDEARTICRTITGRLRSEVSEQDYSAFVRGLNGIEFPSALRPRCRKCQGDGYVWLDQPAGGQSVYRCACPEGQSKPRGIPTV